MDWRTRHYCLVAKCYEEASDVEAAAATVTRGLQAITLLHELESLDPPIPPDTQDTLDTCQLRLSILKFKYDVLKDPSLLKIEEGGSICKLTRFDDGN